MAPAAADCVHRIALVISQLRPGGAERVVVHLASGLRAVGVEPLVVCLQRKGELAGELENEGIQLVALESTQGYDIAALLTLIRTLRDFRPSAIHVHDYSSLPYMVVANSLGRRCPLIFTAHGLLYEGFEGLRRRHRFFSRGIGALAAVSQQVGERHVGYLNWRGAMQIVPNGVPDVPRNVEDRREVREELGISPDELVFLSVGNARPEKGFEDLVEAASRLHRQLPDKPFHVWIAGGLSDSEYCARLQRDVLSCAPPGLRLLGFRQDTRRLYSAADVLVIPSRSEGLPMVLLEAMTAGIPVIATRVGGIPSVLAAECGMLVESGRPEALAGAMAQMLCAEPERRKSMGSAGRRRAIEEFGVGRMVNDYLALYAAAIGKCGKPRHK
ncbi:MAG: glycosyltransferase [Pirellulaceae bacterium]